MSNYSHRRGSIFWALTLIAVGCLFLYHNFDPAVRPWQIIAKYWPVLIIFWGLSKLIDYVHAQANPETAAPPLFSGSEVVLLVLILLLGTLISRIVLRPWHEWPGAMGIQIDDDDFANIFTNSYAFTQTVSQPAGPQPRLIIVNRRGDVAIRASDKPAFDAVVKETVRADNEAEAKKLSDELKFEIVQEGGQYVLRSNLDSLPNSGRNVRLDLDLSVPKTTTAEITAERGDVSIEGLQGEQTLTTKRGDVRAANIEGLVRVHKSRGGTQVRDIKGNVEVDGRGGDVDVANVSGTVTVSGDFSGAVQFSDVGQTLRYNSSRTDLSTQRLSGRLYMEMGSLDARGVDGPFELTTRQKDINLDGFAHSLKITNKNGEIHLRASSPPRQSIDVQSERGGIELVLPEGSSFQMDARSRHGEVESEFNAPSLKVVGEGDEPSIEGTYGKGGPLIRLSTSYGTIRVARQGSTPQSPKAPEAPAPPARETKLLMLPTGPQAPAVAILREISSSTSQAIIGRISSRISHRLLTFTPPRAPKSQRSPETKSPRTIHP
jgi:DUF4097 and DUF4098 domain-containing protein YvlB